MAATMIALPDPEPWLRRFLPVYQITGSAVLLIRIHLDTT